MTDNDETPDLLDGISVVPNPSAKRPNDRQRVSYRTEREQCIEWLLTFGKDPKCAVGYAETIMSSHASRMDQFYRWVWDRENGHTSNLTHSHANRNFPRSGWSHGSWPHGPPASPYLAFECGSVLAQFVFTVEDVASWSIDGDLRPEQCLDASKLHRPFLSSKYTSLSYRHQPAHLADKLSDKFYNYFLRCW